MPARTVLQVDTLDSLPADVLSKIRTTADLHAALVGAVEAQAHVGSLSVGGRTVKGRTIKGDDPAIWGRSVLCEGTEFKVRSLPLGRIGKPLVRGELRRMVVSAQAKGAFMATSCFVHLWLASEHKEPLRSENDEWGSGDTHGRVGVNYVPIHLFNMHSKLAIASMESLGRRNFCSALGSTITVTTEGARISAMPGGAYLLVARSLLGCPISPGPFLAANETHHRDEYLAHRSAAVVALCAARRQAMALQGVNEEEEEEDPTIPDERDADMIFAAMAVTEQGSLSSLLDLIADPVFEPGLTDALRMPRAVLLDLCLAIRVAGNPGTFQLPAASASDQWAASEVNTLFQSYQEPLLDKGGEHVFALDLILHLAVRGASAQLRSYAAARADRTREKKSTRVKRETETLSGLCERIFGNLVFLQRQGERSRTHSAFSHRCRLPSLPSPTAVAPCSGIRVCQDVFGPSHATDSARADDDDADDLTSISTPFGPARLACDPIERARERELRANHMSGLKDTCRPRRLILRVAKRRFSGSWFSSRTSCAPVSSGRSAARSLAPRRRHGRR